MPRLHIWLFIAAGFLLPRLALAAVTTATPVEVGAEGQWFEATSTCNVVVRIPITTYGSSDILTSLTVDNNTASYPADNISDILANSVKVWYVTNDLSGQLNTATANFVGTLVYKGNCTWENTGLSQSVATNGALYVTADIVSNPTPGASCAFEVLSSKIKFQSGIVQPIGSQPGVPPNIFLSPYYPATQLVASHAAIGPTTVSTGQSFNALQFTLHNAGSPITAPVYLQGLTITVRDQAGSVVPPNRALDSLSIRDAGTGLVLGTVAGLAGGNVPVYIPFGVSITTMADVQLQLFGTVNATNLPALPNFRLEVNQPGHMNAVDGLTFKPVDVIPDGSDSFAMSSNLFMVQAAAKTIQVYHTPVLAPAAVVVKGQSNVNPVNFTFVNPGITGSARVDVTQMTLAVTDSNGTTLSPASVFSRVAIAGAVLYGENTSMPATGSLITIPLSSSYISVLYQAVTVTVLADILPNASAVNFRLSLAGSAAVHAQDSNSQYPALVSACYGSDPFPMSSNIIRVASSFLVTGASVAPATLYPKQRVSLLQLTFTNPGPADLGDIMLLSLTLTASDRNGQPVDISGNCVGLALHDSHTTLITQTTPPANDSSVTLNIPGGIAVAPFSSMVLQVEVQMADAPRNPTFRLALVSNTDVSATLPQDPSRPVFVAGTWPIVSQAAAVGGGEGELKLSNYPNPFAAGRATTRIAYYLAQACNVTATLYTLTGDEVKTLCRGEFQAPGEHLLAWDGRTSTGSVVVNGVYLLRLDALPTADGNDIIQLRKIAVVK
jgi:hypothetical protein